MNWLIQHGQAEVVTAALVFYQGIVETHVLDAGALETGSQDYPISLRRTGGWSKWVTSVMIKE